MIRSEKYERFMPSVREPSHESRATNYEQRDTRHERRGTSDEIQRAVLHSGISTICNKE